VSHPGGALGYRFIFPNNRSIVHVTDNEPSTRTMMLKLVNWMRGADVVIHDAQYSPENYERHEGWGHSPYSYPIELAAKAGVPKLYLFHYDPEDDDEHLKRVLLDAKKFIKKKGYSLECELAREGMTVSF
jgi:ribonuclease BN (tRNA processing enzyme)